MNSLEMFMRGRMHVPFPLMGDAYTCCGDVLSSEAARNASSYGLVLRYSPKDAFPDIAKDSRIVFYGLSDYIRNHLTRKITRDDVNESAAFMQRAKIGGGGLAFNRKIWDDVVDRFGGYLPVRISALPEGSTFFPNEPVIEVTSLYSGYGELAAHLEAVMLGMVSCVSTRVTIDRHWLERIVEWLKQPAHAKDSYAIAQWFIHEFGMRASSCSEESELFGRASLLVFKGTDTFNAAFQAWRMGCHDSTGRSILALAHRIVQGYDKEIDCYKNLLAVDNIGSYVADCYNFKRAVAEMLVPLAKSHADKWIVARPDSGNMSENTEWVIQQVQQQKAVNVSLIHGDSVNPIKMYEQIELCYKLGMDPSRFLVFGIGGWRRNQSTRDALSASYKLQAIRKDGYSNWCPVVKLSESITKLSVPGPNVLTRNSSGKTVFNSRDAYCLDAREVYYDGGAESLNAKFLPSCYEQFSVLEDRTINDFNKMGSYPADYGTYNNNPWSDGIRSVQEEYVKNYRENE